MTGDRPSTWDMLPLVAPDGVLKVRVGVAVDIRCTCAARHVLVRVLDTEHGRMVVSRRYRQLSDELARAKADGRWKGGRQRHVPHPPGAMPPDRLPALAKRRWHLAGLGDQGWTDLPFWYDPWPATLFAYGPVCSCHTGNDWSAEPEFKVLIREALASGKRSVDITAPA